MVDGQIVPETVDPDELNEDDNQEVASEEDLRLEKIRHVKQRAKFSRFWSAPLGVDSFNDLN